MEELIEKAKKLLNEIPYITIASVTPDGLPWNSPVYAVHDEGYNFFWNSSSLSQHSQNINLNSSVSIVVYNSTVKAGEGFGLYIEAQAKEIVDQEELENAIKIFYSKKGKELKPTEYFLQKSGQRLYKATPKKFWVNDYNKNNSPADWKTEIKLN